MNTFKKTLTNSHKPLTFFMVLLLSTTALAACAGSSSPTTSASTGIHKIQHIIVIMQENRSFDSYFGTFPGADGIPMQKGAS